MYNLKNNLVSFGLILLSLTVSAQEYRTETGEIDGAKYTIYFPDNWENKLVIFAHGYEAMGSPRSLDQDRFPGLFKPMLDEGYAVAASYYKHQGFALETGIEDSEHLRQKFTEEFGRPDSTFIAGMSMGGGVAIGVSEKYGQSYDGALCMCPLTSRPYLQTRKEFDLISAFNAMYPGYLPPISDIMNPDIPAPDFTQIMAKTQEINKIITEDSVRASKLAARYDLRLSDLAFTLGFGQNVLNDIAVKAGGNPYDNRNTIYDGLGDDYEINQNVVRMSADPSAYDYMTRYSPTGELPIPAVFLHTVYDQLIPARLAIDNYRDMLEQKGRLDHMVLFFTSGQGHCRFTAGEISHAFNSLRKWKATGATPQPGGIK